MGEYDPTLAWALIAYLVGHISQCFIVIGLWSGKKEYLPREEWIAKWGYWTLIMCALATGALAFELLH